LPSELAGLRIENRQNLMQSGRKNVLSHTAVYLVARGLPGVVTFIAIPLFTRLLKPADYGRYVLAAAAVALLNALLFQWLRLSLVRYLPAYREDAARLKSTLMTAAAALALIVAAAAAITCLLPIGRAWREVVLWCWGMLSAQALFDLCCEYCRASIRPWQVMGLHLARATATVAIGGPLVLLGAGWWGPLAGTTAAMILAVGYACRRDWRDVRPVLDPESLAQVARYGIPLSLTVALATLIYSSDRYLIAFFLGEDAAGVYSVAVDFATQTLMLLMMVIHLAIFPLAVRAWENEGHAAVREQMRLNGSLLLAVGVPCVVGLAVIGPGVANCLIGASFRTGVVRIIPVVALGGFLAGLKAYHFDAPFQFAHRTSEQVWIVLAVAVVNILLNLIAIPAYGIAGAAVASVLAYVLSISLAVTVGRRHFDLPFPRRACAQVLTASAAMALLLYPLRSYHSVAAVTSQIVGGSSLYFAVLLASDFLELRHQVWSRLRHRVWPRRAGGPSVTAAGAMS
jgi:O-antigen/teichoic acid export membrane protein